LPDLVILPYLLAKLHTGYYTGCYYMHPTEVSKNPEYAAKIFQGYNEKVYAFSLKNLKNKEDAEGVVQEVFFSLWEEKSKLQDVRNLNA